MPLFTLLKVIWRFGMYFGECEDGGRDRFEDEILTNVYQRMLQALACGGGSLVFMEGQVCKRWRAGKAT